MPEHMTEWLGAYLDGEVPSTHLQQVNAHLAGCEHCQKGLARLSRLSTLLRETPPDVNFTPTDRFTAQVVLQLPRQGSPARRHKAAGLGWRLLPAVAALAALVFVQVASFLNSALSLFNRAGLLDGAITWLPTGAQNSWAVTAIAWLSSYFGETTWQLAQFLISLDSFREGTVAPLVLQAAIGLFYLIWLGLWLLREKQSSESAG